MPFVLDCSTTMAWIFPDEATPETDALRNSLITDTAIVPALWGYEVANVLLVATRRGRLQQSDWPLLQAALAALPITVDNESHQRTLNSTLPLAAQHGLSAYDAAYIELAQRRALPLATLDQRLREVCRAASVPVL